jgi:hypothetical protein
LLQPAGFADPFAPLMQGQSNPFAGGMHAPPAHSGGMGMGHMGQGHMGGMGSGMGQSNPFAQMQAHSQPNMFAPQPMGQFAAQPMHSQPMHSQPGMMGGGMMGGGMMGGGMMGGGMMGGGMMGGGQMNSNPWGQPQQQQQQQQQQQPPKPSTNSPFGDLLG